MAFISESSLLIFAAFAIFLAVGAGAIIVLWIIMPFSIFGTKELLKKSIAEQEKTNRLLRSLLEADLYRAEALRTKEGADEPLENRGNTH
ncbi:MAG: hypothetical protein A2W38_06590 [Deltaproteobacteria bacterium RBG_19FT_COMBO_58_16]|jgi:hypothetical protein|nr:MAG: hypothetical protein A2W38_06590 [Deltaproteobacteria bacterium RBG_19FT_COMBO_58_16]